MNHQHAQGPERTGPENGQDGHDATPAGNRRFHDDVERLVGEVEKMAAMCRRSVSEGMDAFRTLDADAVRNVRELNAEINRLDVTIEGHALDLITLHQPMARDLRTIGACLKSITYLNRIGRYGYDIAEAAAHLNGKSHVRKLVGLPLMAEKALGVLDVAMTAFRERDPSLARTVQEEDDVVDGLYEQILRECVTHMIEEPRNITACTQYILVARHLERVGDNAGKIAEKTIYMVTGERRLDTA